MERNGYAWYKTQKFKFPEPTELRIFLKDILEDEVDEKYYLKSEQVEKLLARKSEVFKGKIVKMIDNNGKDTSRGDGISFTLTGSGRNCGNNQIIMVNNPKHSKQCEAETDSQPFIVASRGRYDKDGKIKQHLEPKFDGTTNAITTVQKDNYVQQETRIRKLTPTECFRLMGFLNDEINLEGLSDTQKYKLAGNG